MITDTAKLHNVDWDGYMKYFAPSQKFMLAKQKLFADSLHRRITVGRINEKSKDVHETEHNLTSDTNDQSLRRRQIK